MRDTGVQIYTIAINQIAYDQRTLERIAGKRKHFDSALLMHRRTGSPERVYTDDNIDAFKQEVKSLTASC